MTNKKNIRNFFVTEWSILRSSRTATAKDESVTTLPCFGWPVSAPDKSGDRWRIFPLLRGVDIPIYRDGRGV